MGLRMMISRVSPRKMPRSEQREERVRDLNLESPLLGRILREIRTLAVNDRREKNRTNRGNGTDFGAIDRRGNSDHRRSRLRDVADNGEIREIGRAHV